MSTTYNRKGRDGRTRRARQIADATRRVLGESELSINIRADTDEFQRYLKMAQDEVYRALSLPLTPPSQDC